MCVLWGIPYLMIKVAVSGVSTPMVVFVRTGGAALVLLPLAVRSLRWSVVRRHWAALLGFAVAEVIVPWGLLSEAERYLPSSLTGLIIAAVPMVALVAGRLLGDARRAGTQQWIGLVVGFLGVAVLAGPALVGGQARGIVLMIPVVIGYAIGPIVVARWLGEVPNLVAVTICMIASATCYAPGAMLSWPAELPSAPVLAALVGLAVVCTALAFLVFFALLREVETSRAMVFTYVNPAVAVAAGVVVLDEPLTGIVLASFGLILAGSVLATASRAVEGEIEGLPPKEG
jgi:drug/metabolite transporter (DMT)-like permease